MTRGELHEKLDLLGINHNRYSLYDDLRLDSIVLFHNYENWEVFYFAAHFFYQRFKESCNVSFFHLKTVPMSNLEFNTGSPECFTWQDEQLRIENRKIGQNADCGEKEGGFLE